MTKKLLTIGAVVAAVALITVLAFGWFFGPTAGFGPIGYGMGPGMMGPGFAGGWGSFSWGWRLLFGLIRLAFWLIPIALIAALVAWLIKPNAPQSNNQ